MIDFDALVLGPAMNVFARPVTIIPIKSQDSFEGYAARGVYSERPVDIITQGDGVLASTDISLGIRLSEYQIPPEPGDKVVIDGRTFLIDDRDDDGQGGTAMALKEIK